MALFCMSLHRIEGAYKDNSYITCNVCNHDLPDLHDIVAEGPYEFLFDLDNHFEGIIRHDRFAMPLALVEYHQRISTTLYRRDSTTERIHV